MAESMLDALTTYYREQGILSTHFTCPHKAACKGDCTTFTGPRSAFVSTGYERHDLPRLLFLSLDTGDGIDDPQHGLPEMARKWEDNRGIDRSPPYHKNKHWYRTHELAWYILKRFDPELKIVDVNRHFAHANAAKCCMNKPNQRQADPRLFINCREYLRGELDLLAPDILVTQGDWAKRGVEAHYGVTRKIDRWSSVIEMNGREVFWLHTYHPRHFGGFHGQRRRGKGWEEYALKIRDFAEQQGWPGT